jgi:hypothetical protein
MSLRNEGVAPTTVTTLVDLNTVGDTVVNVPFAKYIVRRMTLFDVSTTLAASSATIGAYTAASAGGTAIVTPATATGLTAATKFNDRTIAASADYQTARTLYIRVGVAHGSAATVSVAFELECLE